MQYRTYRQMVLDYLALFFGFSIDVKNLADSDKERIAKNYGLSVDYKTTAKQIGGEYQ